MDRRMINFTPYSQQNYNDNYDLPPFSAEYLEDNNRPLAQPSYCCSGVVNDMNMNMNMNMWTPNSSAFAEPVPMRMMSMPPSTSSGPAHGGGNSNTTTKKAIRWSIEEHRLFLIGMKKSEKKGDWKSISRKYVTTRSATQVASHAQKFFKRQQSQQPKDSKESQPVTGDFKKKRTSIHDLKVEDVVDDDIEIARLKKAIEEQQQLRRAESMNKDIPLNFHQ